MDTLYSVLARWDHEWQSIYYTDSKALFEQIERTDSEVFFEDFSDELKQQLRTVRAAFELQHSQHPLDPEEDMSIVEAMEWLEVVSPKFPIIVAGETELTCSWNW